jgi:hypothetical protein
MKNKIKQMKKIIKLSVAAALAATAMNAAVVDNVKLGGNAKLFYETNDSGTASMFDNHAATKGQVIVNVKASASIGPITANVRNATITTLGLENGVIGGTQVNQSADGGTANFTDIANLSATIGQTTLIAGKQELNTPMCFTEGWNVHRNTFEAGVLVTKNLIPGSTVVFADVKTTNASGANIHNEGAFDTPINAEMAAIHTNVAGLPVNWYYYDVGTTSVNWVDTAFTVAGAKVKVIAAERDEVVNNGSAQAISVATKVAGLNVFAAYSTVSNDGVNFMNVATTKKTKLPTQAVYVDGTVVAQANTDAFKIKLSGMSVGPVKLAAQYVSADQGTANDNETDIIAKTKIGNVDFKALLMFVDKETTSDDCTKFRVYANYSF